MKATGKKIEQFMKANLLKITICILILTHFAHLIIFLAVLRHAPLRFVLKYVVNHRKNISREKV